MRVSNVIGVLLAAVLMVVLRSAWYAHFAGVDFGHLVNHVVADLTKANHQTLLLGFGLSLLVSIVLSWLMGHIGGRSPIGGLMAGLTAFVGFGLTTQALQYVYAGQTLKALEIDLGYLAAAYLLAGLVIGSISPRRRSREASERAKLFAAEH